MKRLVLLLLVAGGCEGSGSAPPLLAWDCEELPGFVNVTGIYDYEGGSPAYILRGTITFVQTGDEVRVTGTTYENADDRELDGGGTLVNNRLVATLVPKNGDPDYEAIVTFLFSPDGNEFCCGFSDTNDDIGPIGSYVGFRR